MTLAIMPALILNCAGQRFAMPQTAIAELVWGRSEQRIEWIRNAPVMRLRGTLLPLVALQDVLGIGGRTEHAADTYVAVIGIGTQRFGIMIDGVEDAEEIVVKPLSPALRGLSIFAGSAILGDGRITMILDPNGLAAAVGFGDARDADNDQVKLAPIVRRGGLLLFRAGDGVVKAVTLASVTRIEEISADQVEWINDAPVLHYRGAPMPLVAATGTVSFEPRRKRPVLILAHQTRTIGLVVDEVLDAVDETPTIDSGLARPGILGTAMIAAKLVEIIDAAYYLDDLSPGGSDAGRSAA
jgi:two-component system chemotaxis sensor kinase CheA